MDADRFSDRVLKYVLSNNMLEKGDKVVAGISGGADSMCLLGLLIDWRERMELGITVLHVNHGIRGTEADSDEKFVRDFCERVGAECRTVRADIPAMARETGCTEEEAGRNFRYRAFEELCRETGSNRIAVAHNMNDNAETVLFNLVRGTGIAGLGGIAPYRRLSGNILLIRPLLSSDRSDIEAYIAARGIGHVTDSTNLENDYSRNCLRNLVIPVLKEKVNAAAENHMAQLAAEAKETEEFLSELASQILEEVRIEGQRIDSAKLSGYGQVIARRVIRLLISESAGRLKDIERIHTDAVLELMGRGPGKSLNLPYGIRAVTGYKDLMLVRDRADMDTNLSDGPEYTGLQQDAEKPPENGITLELGDTPDTAVFMIGKGRRLTVRLEKYDSSKEFPKNLYTKWFDYDKIKSDISIRSRQSGDYLMIRMNGRMVRKDLTRWFIDNKIPRDVREDVPLLAAGSHVLWVCGYRRDDSCLVDGHTGRVLKVELEPAHEG